MQEWDKDAHRHIWLGEITCKAYLPIMANHPEMTPIFCSLNARASGDSGTAISCCRDLYRADDLIEARPDAVLNNSATGSHLALARALLTQCSPVFVDKPPFYPPIQPLGHYVALVQRQLQKSRPRLPAQSRVFIYDDFFHVLDTRRYIAPGLSMCKRCFVAMAAAFIEKIRSSNASDYVRHSGTSSFCRYIVMNVNLIVFVYLLRKQIRLPKLIIYGFAQA